MRYEPELVERAVNIVRGGGGRTTISKVLGVSDRKAAELRAIALYLIERDAAHTEDIRSDITFAQAEVKYWKRKYKEVSRRLGFERAFLNIVKESLLHLECYCLRNFSALEGGREVKREGGKKAAATLLLGDFHANEVVDSEAVLGLNKYDFGIYLDRLGRVVGKVYSLINSLPFSIYKLNIDILGDLVSGFIHKELEETNEPEDFLASLYIAQSLAEVIKFFAKVVPEVHVHGVVGNHGRKTKKPSYKKIQANLDYLVYKTVELLVGKLDNVHFHFPASWFLTYTCEGFDIGMFHGDGIRSYLRLPYYGITDTVKSLFVTLRKQLEIDVSIWELGHFHQPAYLAGNIFLNGSLIGVNEFSLKKVKTVSFPCQWFYVLSGKEGVALTYNINPLLVRDEERFVFERQDS